MSTSLAVREANGHELASFSGAAPLITQAMETLDAVSQFVQKKLTPDIDFGVIPGTGEKKVLLQPGAQKIGMLYNTRPSYRVEPHEMGGGHVEYVVYVSLVARSNGAVLAEGIGSCSTMESRYRYRRGEPESTGRPVPAKYWEQRKTDPEGASLLIGGKGHTTKKIDGQWIICKASAERVENPDIHDSRNTVLKMAKKRAFVDAAMSLGCVSDLFTQDIDEDYGMDKEAERQQRSQPPAQDIPASWTPQPKEEPWSVNDFNGWVDQWVVDANAWWTRALERRPKDRGELPVTGKFLAPFNKFMLVGHLAKWLESAVPPRVGLAQRDHGAKCEVLAFEMLAHKEQFEAELKTYCHRTKPLEIKAEMDRAAARKAQDASDASADSDGKDSDVWPDGRE